MNDQPTAGQTVDIASLTFDEALAELQRSVAELEQGGLTLERSIELYEWGVALHERCAGLLGQPSCGCSAWWNARPASLPQSRPDRGRGRVAVDCRSDKRGGAALDPRERLHSKGDAGFARE